MEIQKSECEKMAQAGLHFGHRTSKTHPKMKPYICGTRNGIHIFDLEKTQEKLEEALKAVGKIISEGKTLLLVGTKIQARVMTKNFGREMEIPFINIRWLGGTFTNFETLKKRITYFKELEHKKETGELEKYTKKERLLMNRKLDDLEIKFGGIKKLEKLPDAIFNLDMKKDYLAIKEAKAKKIIVFAVADADVNPGMADYFIPANDDAVPAIKYILERLKDIVLKNKPKI